MIVLRVLIVAICLMATAPSALGQVDSDDGWDPAWPMSSAVIEELDAPPPDMAHYSLDISLDPARRALGGSFEVLFANHTGGSIDFVPFRLFPNAAYYGEGSTAVTDVTVDGVSRSHSFDVLDTVLLVPLNGELAPGGTARIAFDFETIVPVNSPGSFGIFSHDAERETWVLSDWYPVLAGWDVDTGWGLEPPTIWGDPTFTDTSTYDVRLAVPAGMSVVSTGQERLDRTEEEQDIHHIVTGPVRELALVLDNRLEVHQSHIEDIRLNLYLDAGTPDSGAVDLLLLARAAMQDFSVRYGPYPYDELDIVQTELAGALGVSWSGLLFMDAQRLHDGLPTVAMPSSILAFTLVHEIAHQWWGVKVGVNSNDHAFMNESLANYLTIISWGVIFDEATAYEALVQQVAGPYLAFLGSNPDGVVDRSISEVASMNEFGRLVYGKGGLGLHAIRLEIGDEAFFTALDAYATEHSFLIASPGDLLTAFETASGSELDTLWTFWFDAAQTTPADVQELLTSSSG